MPADPAAARGSGPGTDELRAMFDRIAPIYDLMNTVMTAGVDKRWRVRTVDALRLRPGMRVLDVACGSGALARLAAARVTASGAVAGIDVSRRMLARARARRVEGGSARPEYRQADALAIPFPDGSFDAACIGFGLRNMPDYAACLEEVRRVLAAGGRMAVLEIAEPPGRVARLVYRAWFRRAVPLLGRLAGGGAAYAYLPASMEDYPTPSEVGRLMMDAGFVDVRWRHLVSGLATLHVARRPGA